MTLPGLGDKHVLEAAEVDGERVPWAIAPDLPWLSTVELEQAVRRVMVDCLAYLPESRPKLTALGQSLRCVCRRLCLFKRVVQRPRLTYPLPLM